MRRLTMLCALLMACGGVSESQEDAGTPDADNDPCLTNTCECEVDADCDNFELCDTTSTPGRICVCAPTYEDNGTACAFAGAPADPGFQSPDVWAVTDATRGSIDPANAGDIDLGVGILLPTGQCQLDSFTQTFTMPPRERAEAFAVDINYRTVDPNLDFVVGARVAIGDAWYAELPFQFDFGVQSFCLGDAGYGGDVEFRITPNRTDFSCPTSVVGLEVDRFAIRPAMPGECPAEVGRPDNHDMEGNDGWTLTTVQSGTAALVAGAGAGGTRALEIATTTQCSSATGTAPIVLPSDARVPNSAIQFFLGGDANDIVEVRLDNRPLTRLTPTGGNRRVCIPQWAKGGSSQLSFTFRRSLFTACTNARNRLAHIDNVEVVSEPACGEDSDQFDHGFETFFSTPGLAPGWAAVEGGTNSTLSPVTIDNNQAQANSGFGSLHLRALSRCTSTLAERQIIVPEASGADGPAVVAFINAPTSDGTISMGTENTSVLAPEGVGYQRNVLCIPPLFKGRPVRVFLQANGGGGLCAESPNLNGFVDDITVGTDPSCPAN